MNSKNPIEIPKNDVKIPKDKNKIPSKSKGLERILQINENIFYKSLNNQRIPLKCSKKIPKNDLKILRNSKNLIKIKGFSKNPSI